VNAPSCERAAATDTWCYRLLKVSELGLLSDDLKTVQYWQSKLLKPRFERRWLLEVSGRLLLYADSIVENAELAARAENVRRGKAIFAFNGVAFGLVSSIEASDVFQVWYEPLEADDAGGWPADVAHAELCLVDHKYVGPDDKITPDGIEILRRSLSILRAAEDGEAISQLESLCSKGIAAEPDPPGC
jgi:hypothetical protein